MKNLAFVFRALSYRNYRLFFTGQSISLIGTWMQRIAVQWLVYRMTNSPFILGVVGFAGQLPTFLVAPFAGVLADRWNKHRIIVITQILSMIQALVLAVLILTSAIEVWHVLVLSTCLAIINGFDMPARQSFVVDMVENRDDLGNAIALNSAMFNGARLVGPTIAGILIAVVGEGVCFLLNALSYVAIVIALLAMTVKPFEAKKQKVDVLAELKQGFSYAFGSPPIRSVIILLALVSLVAMPYVVLMPVFAKAVLHGGPQTLGFLLGGTGIGALIGAAYLASRKSARGLGRITGIATMVFGSGLFLLSFSRSLWLSLFLVLIAGLGMMVTMASSNTVLQTVVHDDKRARVMSLFTMAFMGTVPLGSLLAGGLASSIGTPNTLLLGGVACIIGALVYMRRLPELNEKVKTLLGFELFQ